MSSGVVVQRRRWFNVCGKEPGIVRAGGVTFVVGSAHKEGEAERADPSSPGTFGGEGLKWSR